MGDAKATENGVPRDEWRGEAGVPLQVLDVRRRQLLLVPVTAPSFTPPRQDWLAKLPEVCNFLACCCYESCSSASIYGDWPVWGHGHEKTENDLHGPSSFALLPYHSGSLVSGPMQKSLSSSSTPSPVTTLSESLLKYRLPPAGKESEIIRDSSWVSWRMTNSRATVNVGVKKILLYSSHLGPSVED